MIYRKIQLISFDNKTVGACTIGSSASADGCVAGDTVGSACAVGAGIIDNCFSGNSPANLSDCFAGTFVTGNGGLGQYCVGGTGD